MIKAVGYIRRSTDRQDTSLKDQRVAIEQFADTNGYKVLRFYEDDAVSGTSVSGRKQFLEMINTAQNGAEFKAILVWDVKRFSRGDSDEAGYYRHLLRQNGIEVVYITENLKGDDTDDLVLPTKQWLARQESKDKSRDVIRGQLSRVFKGFSTSGHPYGYYRQIEDKTGVIIQVCKRGEKSRANNEDYTRLIPGDSFEIKVIKRIFDCYTNRGMGKRLIARMLNKEGIPSPRGKKWGLCAIDTILSNQAYMGNLVYNKRSRAKFHRIIKTKKGYEAQYKGKVVKLKTERHRNREQWIVVENVIGPIISKELFSKAQRVRQERTKDKSFSGRATESNYLWTGIIRCKHCGKAMTGRSHKIKHGRNYYYSCYQCEEVGNHRRSVVSVLELDKALIGRIKERFLNSDRLNNTLKAIKEKLSELNQDSRLTVSEIDKKLSENEKDINRLLDCIDSRNKNLINNRLDKLREERVWLESERVRAAKSPVPLDIDKLAKEILSHANDFEKVLERGSMAERKQYLRSYIGQIVIDVDKKHAKVGFYPIPKSYLIDDKELSLCSESGIHPRHL
jgi:DNA invertase Pin-like site-specific DNA recombinase